MAHVSLLPANASRLEHLAAQALAQIQRVPIPLRELYNPDTCPEKLLPYLAWTFSVDRWDSRWPVRAKRAAIRSAYFIHSRKGTLGALRRIVEPLGFDVTFTEWWETTPESVPGTFRVELGIQDSGITGATYIEIAALIDDAKPVSRHLTGLTISLETSGHLYVGCSSSDGDSMDVYPPAQNTIDVTGIIGVTGREHFIDRLDVYP